MVRRTSLIVVAAAILAAVGLPRPAVADDPGWGQVVPGEYLVELKPEGTPAGVATSAGALAPAERLNSASRFVRLLLDPTLDPTATVAWLEGLPGVEHAQPNLVLTSADSLLRKRFFGEFEPAEPAGAAAATIAQPALGHAGLPVPGTSAPVVVAVLDTGIDASHPALRGRIGAGYDFVGQDGQPAEEANGPRRQRRRHDRRGVRPRHVRVGAGRPDRPLCADPARAGPRHRRHRQLVDDHEGSGMGGCSRGASRQPEPRGSGGRAPRRPPVGGVGAGRTRGRGRRRQRRVPGPGVPGGIPGCARRDGHRRRVRTTGPGGRTTGRGSTWRHRESTSSAPAPGGRYVRWGGTSASAPIVTAAMALVAGEMPGAAVDDMVGALTSTARPDGLDGSSAYGRVDIAAACRPRSHDVNTWSSEVSAVTSRRMSVRTPDVQVPFTRRAPSPEEPHGPCDLDRPHRPATPTSSYDSASTW